MKTYRAFPNVDTIDNLRGSIYISDYSGGLNKTDSNEILNDNEAIVRQNWNNEKRGAIQVVNGYTKANSTTLGAAGVMGLFRVYLSAGTKHLLALCNGTLKYSTDNAAFSAVTGGTGLSTTEFSSGVNYNDLFFLTNKTNNLYHYTAGTSTLAAATDKPTNACRILLKRSDRRLIALNNDTAGSTLYFSKVDPTGTAGDDWSAPNDAGSIAIDGAKSERLIGGATFGAYDIIFKSYCAFRVWGYPTPQAERLAGSPGCAAPQSVAQGDGLCFFLGWDAVWMYDGTRFIKISEPIKDLIEAINSSYIENAFGVYRKGYYWLFYTKTGDTTNKNCVIYDVFHSNPYSQKNTWFERPMSMTCPVVLDGVGDSNQLYAGSSQADGFVYRLDYSSTGADGTSNIEAVYQTKYFDADTPYVVKRYPKIKVRYFLSQGTLYFNWYTNRGSTSGSFSVSASQTGVALGSFILDTSILAGVTELTHTEILPDTAIGKDISIKVTYDGVGTPPIIRDIEVDYEGLYIE